MGLLVAAFLAFILARSRRAERTVHSREADLRLQALEVKALTDILTGLRNRRAFEEDLASELARARRMGDKVALAM
jgi:PleD family two-component response regulator